MTRRWNCAICLLLLVLPAGAVCAQERQDATLYERLGRYDGIARIADDYLKGVRADPQLARFIGRSSDSLARARQLLKEQWCALTGGPCVYVGRDMKTAHGGLGITEADWALNMKYLGAALDKSHITGREKEEMLALVDGFRKQIVEKEKQ
jgi:hemoglobin